MNKISTGLIIPTKNAEKTLNTVLRLLCNSPIEFSSLTIDSSDDQAVYECANIMMAGSEGKGGEYMGYEINLNVTVHIPFLNAI